MVLPWKRILWSSWNNHDQQRFLGFHFFSTNQHSSSLYSIIFNELKNGKNCSTEKKTSLDFVGPNTIKHLLQISHNLWMVILICVCGQICSPSISKIEEWSYSNHWFQVLNVLIVLCWFFHHFFTWHCFTILDGYLIILCWALVLGPSSIILIFVRSILRANFFLKRWTANYTPIQPIW